MFVFLYWQLTPDHVRQPRRFTRPEKAPHLSRSAVKLFVIEVLLRLTTCAEMLLVLAGAALGLLRNATYGGLIAAPRIVFPILLFVLFNLLLSAGLRNLIERLLTHSAFVNS